MKANILNVTEERAIKLAMRHLTRRSDIRIFEENQFGVHRSFDLVAAIVQGERLQGFFAIEVKGVFSKASANKTYENARKAWYGNTESFLPVCFFLFTMEDDKGYFAWLDKPLYEQDYNGEYSLKNNTLTQLDDKGSDAIVEEVEAWFKREKLNNGFLFNAITDDATLRLALKQFLG